MTEREKTFRRLSERFYPLIFGCISGYTVWHLFKAKPIPEKIYDMMANGITVGGIIVGFLATTVALIYSMQNSYIISQLKKLGHFATFMQYFRSAVRWCMFLAAFGCAGFFLDFKNVAHAEFYHIFVSAWVCVFVTAGLSAYRFIHVLCILLHDETE